MRCWSTAMLGSVLAVALVGACTDGGGGRTEGSDTSVVTLPADVTTTNPGPDATASTTDVSEPDDGTATTAGPTVPPGDPLVVETDLGPVRGAPSGVAGVRSFRALPYAAPPIGEARWSPPQPRHPYEGVLDATRPGGACPQGPAELPMLIIPASTDDCLTVSVWSPDGADGLPVIVWIHGGMLRQESAEDPLTVGDRLAARGAVVVGVNYRLGPFGFLTTDELVARGVTGNQGLADQVAALQWVQRNIAFFGGDPRNVTLVGESAGGAAVCAHLVSPASAGLFHRAVVQSPTLGLGPFPRQPVDVVGGCDRVDDLDEAVRRGNEFLRAVGCQDVACLRTRSDAELLAVPYSPTIVDDGLLVDGTAIDAGRRGDLDDTPILMSSNGTEANLFTLGTSEPSDADLVGLFAEVSDEPERLLAFYPPGAGVTNLDRYRTMLTETRFACRNVAFAAASTGTTFLVLNAYESANDPFGVGPTHGTELIPLFGHPDGINGLAPELTDPALVVLSEVMQRAWVEFAATGDPGELFVPYRTDRRITIMADPIRLIEDTGERCEQLLALTG